MRVAHVVLIADFFPVKNEAELRHRKLSLHLELPQPCERREMMTLRSNSNVNMRATAVSGATNTVSRVRSELQPCLARGREW